MMQGLAAVWYYSLVLLILCTVPEMAYVYTRGSRFVFGFTYAVITHVAVKAYPQVTEIVALWQR